MRISRREFAKLAGMAGTCWSFRRPSLIWASSSGHSELPCLAHSGFSYAPFIEPFLKQIEPGNDEFTAEKYAYELEHLLDAWTEEMKSGTQVPQTPKEWLEETLVGTVFDHLSVHPLRAKPPLETDKILFPPAEAVRSEVFLASLARYLSPLTRIEICDLQIDAIDIVTDSPLQLHTTVHYNLCGRLDGNRREQRTGEWKIDWLRRNSEGWRITHWSAASELRSRLTGPGFADITAATLGHNNSYREQMMYGIDHWRTVLDGACGIDVYGNNGICVGDYDGDGLDDIYVCQPAGLPNRLYRNLGDGTFLDVTEQAGVGVLDSTSCALFADLTNSGRQDLVVVCASGPLLFANRGNGAYELKPDAFQFARPLQGSFTGASIADYDRDGLLDLYFCTYSFYQGLSEYQYPSPYYDAQNGPPNILMHNRGNYSFEDTTVPSGMDVNNNRFSFDALWCDYDRDGWPDLYVVNDFGRKVLYRNNRNGTFTDVSAAAGIEDPGEGMSATWFDYDNDGRDDLYVVNMWESAGRRISDQPHFLSAASDTVRQVFRQGSMGNTLLRNQGPDGTFSDTTEDTGTRFGGWNWGSDSWDVDHDGYPDLYIANGFISGENRQDLSSFYWRHIAARALDAGGRSQAYVDAWSAVNEFIRSGYTWSGYQRNNFYLNNRNSTFTEAASILGIDCIEDSRSFALCDLDGDGRLEILLKNRTAPQLRILQNRITPLSDSILFSLRGTRSNRDAIGAIIELETHHGTQVRTLRAGTGFLAQNGKAVHFGLGEDYKTLRATIHWPNGDRQVFENLPPNHGIEIVEGAPGFNAIPFKPSHWSHSTAETPAITPSTPSSRGTWILDPIQIPNATLVDLNGTSHTLGEWKGRTQLLAFVAPSCNASMEFLHELNRGQAEIKAAGIAMFGVLMNAHQENAAIPDHFSYPLMLADEYSSHILNLFRRYLFDYRRDIPVPSAFLIDDKGQVVRIYHQAITTEQLLADSRHIPRSAEERLKAGLPFPGRFYRGDLHHNYFTYGVAYLQYKDYDEAQAAFELSLRRTQHDPTVYYDLGVIAINKGRFDEAQSRLQKSVEIDPENADAWNNLGVANSQLGDQDAAQSCFRRALDRQPAHPIAVQNMVRMLLRQNRPQEARQVLLKAIDTDPRQADPHKWLGMYLIDDGDLDGARTEFEKALDLEPENTEAMNALGVVFMQKGENDRAMHLFEKCMRLAPKNNSAVLNLAVLYMSANRADTAHELLTGFLKQNPEDKDVRELLKEVDSRH